MAMLRAPLSRIAFCWRIERRDGGGLALTSHDQPLEVDGALYEPAPGMTPHAMKSATGLQGGDADVSGALTADALSRRDMALGLWDGASVRMIAVDWEAPDAEQLALVHGELGEIRTKDGAFEASLLGPLAKLNRPANPEASPSCRASFGGPQCQIDLAGRQLEAIVTGEVGTVLTLDRTLGQEYRFGRLVYLGGDNRGRETAILSVNGNDVTVRDVPRGAIEAGARVRLTQGCDKLLATCRDRFANAVNFRGEPHLPGRDILTRYPGA